MRVLLLALAAWCSAGALTSATGIGAAMLGAVAGVVLGEHAAGRPWRLWVIAVAGLLASLLGLVLASLSTNHEFIPDLIGPARALKLAAILRYGTLAIAAVTVVRAAARRVPTLGIVEIAAVVAAVALPFAAHRDGQIARPLWLSDWAWRHAIDPATALVAIGVGIAALLALLLMLDSRQRAGASSFLALPVLAIIAALLFSTKSTPPSAAPSENDDAMHTKGDEPIPQNRWGSADPGQGGAQGTGSNRPDTGSNQGSQGGSQQQQGSNGQGQRPPPPSDWQDPSQGQGKQTPMAIVLLGDDYQPPMQAFYLREETWSELYGGRLVSPRDRTFDADIPRGEPLGKLVADPPGDAPGMQVLHADVALLTQHRKDFFIGEPTQWESTENPDPAHFVRAYRFTAVVPTLDFDKLIGHEAGSPSWSPELREYYTTIPSDPRYAELANKIVDTLPPQLHDDPFARAAAIKLWLDKNTSYSLSHRHANVPDPVADFLFGDRIGYCVHMAHSAVYLWRAAGIPARVGVGYRVDADHQRGSSLLVSAGDAHAWPELYLEGVGWIVFDIAPAKNLDPPSPPPDSDMQQQLAQLARHAPPDPKETNPVPEAQRRPLGKPIALAGGSLIAFILLALYAIKAWRRIAPTFASPEQLPRVGYRTALDLLSDAGRTRELGETREKFARRLAAEAPVFADITALHIAARLGPPGTPPRASRQQWRAMLAQLRAQLAQGAPAGRRLARKLHPISFRSSR